MFKIDPDRTDLALEFKRKPYGRHSPDLQAVLSVMRGLPIEGKHLLVTTKPQEEWVLARMTGSPVRPELVPEHVFTDIREAEWLVFKLRWKLLTGRDLDVD
ncbi:MAG: hypothetical protein JWO51_757 [Rhodospirillales bacterium]|nr:hypothetical protein [Rhodospirillales bacterium]